MSLIKLLTMCCTYQEEQETVTLPKTVEKKILRRKKISTSINSSQSDRYSTGPDIMLAAYNAGID